MLFRCFELINDAISYIWNSIINRPIPYTGGITIFKIGVLFILFSLLFRVFIIPTIGGSGFRTSIPGGSVNYSNYRRLANQKSTSMKTEKL